MSGAANNVKKNYLFIYLFFKIIYKSDVEYSYINIWTSSKKGELTSIFLTESNINFIFSS